MKIGLYPMVADIMHAGHILAIEEAKNNCDYLIIALHCCPVYKNPVQSIFERFIQLRSVKWVDEVIVYQDINDLDKMLNGLNYDVYFLGVDYKNKDFEGKDILLKQNKEIFYLQRNHSLSSTELKQRIISNLDKKKV